MALSNPLNKKTMIALMIAATGLSTSMAAAQFKVEYSAKAESAPKAEVNKSVMVFQSHDDAHTYEIKIVDGKVVVAKIDGDQVDDNHIQITDNVVIFIDKDGKTIHEIKRPEVHNLHGKNVWVTSAGGNFVADDNVKIHRFFNGDDGTAQVKANYKVKMSPPKVMLGINLGEPSAILRKHLKLKDGMHVILVERVIEGLPAQAAGLQEFDVIISIDGSDQASGESLGKILAEKEAGEIMKLIVLRSGEKIKVKVELAEYNAQALGGIIYDDIEMNEETKGHFEAVRKDAQDIEFKILSQFENGEFGHIQKKHLANIKAQLHKQLSSVKDDHRMSLELHAKALDAMKDAERQLIEFVDGKLTIRAAAAAPVIVDKLKHLDHAFPQVMSSHMDGMETRLAALESRIDHQISEMGEQMDQLMSMFERLMDRLEKNDD